MRGRARSDTSFVPGRLKCFCAASSAIPRYALFPTSPPDGAHVELAWFLHVGRRLSVECEEWNPDRRNTGNLIAVKMFCTVRRSECLRIAPPVEQCLPPRAVFFSQGRRVRRKTVDAAEMVAEVL